MHHVLKILADFHYVRFLFRTRHALKILADFHYARA